MTTDELRAKFETWYVENVFDYENNPVGSRQCGLQWKACQFGNASRGAEVEALRRDAERYHFIAANAEVVTSGRGMTVQLNVPMLHGKRSAEDHIDAAMAKESGDGH